MRIEAEIFIDSKKKNLKKRRKIGFSFVGHKEAKANLHNVAVTYPDTYYCHYFPKFELEKMKFFDDYPPQHYMPGHPEYVYISKLQYAFSITWGWALLRITFQ